MQKNQDDVVKVTTSLTGLQITCSADSATKSMLRSFEPTASTLPRSTDLEIQITQDQHSLGEAIGKFGSASTHLRHGNNHAWINQQTRCLQTFMVATPSQARLILDECADHDAATSARPASYSIATWATYNNIFPLHASAVSLQGTGLIFVGEGGRGKTTTALALAMRGWKLIADDICFLTARDNVYELHGLYATTIVTEEVAQRCTEFVGERIGVTQEGKIASFLPREITSVPSARLRGIVFLNRNEDEPYKLTRIGTRQALSAWQESLRPTQRLLAPATSLFTLMTNVSRNVPAWQLNLGWDFQSIDRSLRQQMKVDHGHFDS